VADPGAKRDRAVLVGDLRSSRSRKPRRRRRAPAGFDPDRPEASYRDAVPEIHRRRLAQFFTPETAASLMTDWVMAVRPGRVLDPCTGTGVFVRQVLAREPGCRVTALDVDPLVLAAARKTLDRQRAVTLRCEDFLTWRSRQRFDGVLANPPYLKHHDFLYEHGDIFAEIGGRSGVRLSRLSNLYLLFIFEICRRLRPGGRAAVIVPGEWVNANYGAALKRFLLDRGLLRVLIYFAPDSELFGDALTTVAVLLIERGRADETMDRVQTAYVARNVSVESLRPLLAGERPRPRGVIVRRIATAKLREARKWDSLLARPRRAAVRGLVPLSRLARTCRGIATGANRFFHVTADTARAFGLRRPSLRACLGRALDAPYPVFGEDDLAALAAAGRPVHLLDLRGEPARGEQRYLAQGEREGLPRRYLLAAREPWYSMEQRPPAPILATVFGRKGLRFVLNAAGVHNLTAFHCVYPHSPDPLLARALVAVLCSRVVQARARQYQRVYGGGLAKIEPRDLLEIPVPDLSRARRAVIKRLATALAALDRASRQGRGLDAALDRIDALVKAAAG